MKHAVVTGSRVVGIPEGRDVQFVGDRKPLGQDLRQKEEIEARTGKNKWMKNSLKDVGNNSCLKLQTKYASNDT